MSGWIKLHRKMVEWEWYDDSNCFRVFTHLLLVSNHRPNKWRGNIISRGQRLTSLGNLAKETGLTVSKVRTAISKLESTGEIASKSHAQHTVFTIKNYDLYQGDDTEIADESQANSKALADESQANDKALATNKNDKNEKELKNERILVKPKPKDDLSYEPFFELGMDQVQIDEVKQIRKDNKGGKLTQRVINALAKEFSQANALGITNEGILNEWASRGWKAFKAEWTQQAKSGGTGRNANKNALVESGAYSQKTAQTIDILNNWTPGDD